MAERPKRRNPEQSTLKMARGRTASPAQPEPRTRPARAGDGPLTLPPPTHASWPAIGGAPPRRLAAWRIRRRRRRPSRSCAPRQKSRASADVRPRPESGRLRRLRGRCGRGPAARSAGAIGGVSRLSSGAPKITAVGTSTGGSSTTYQAAGRSTGRSASPMPSAKAFCPKMKTGTSAPSERPKACSRSRGR